MKNTLLVLLIVAVVAIGIMLVLYFLGKKLQKKQNLKARMKI